MNTFGKPLSHLFDEPTDILSPINLFSHSNITLTHIIKFDKLPLSTDKVDLLSKCDIGLQ